MNINISSDGSRLGTKITNTENGERIAGVYAFQVQGNAQSPLIRGTFFCHAEQIDLNCDGKVIEVPQSLRARAHDIANRYANPTVTAALAELIGETFGK